MREIWQKLHLAYWKARGSHHDNTAVYLFLSDNVLVAMVTHNVLYIWKVFRPLDFFHILLHCSLILKWITFGKLTKYRCAKLVGAYP